MSALPSVTLRVWEPGAGLALEDLLSEYATAHPDLKPDSLEQYRVATNLVLDWRRACLAAEGITVSPDEPLEFGCAEIFFLPHFEKCIKWLVDTPKKKGARPGEKRSLRTVKGKRDMLLTLWEFAYDREHVTPQPPLRKKLARLKPPKEDPVVWFPEQMAKIIEQARKAKRVDYWLPAHWITFLTAKYYTVERLQSLLSCRLEDLRDNVLSVRGGSTKDKKPGTHELPPWLATMIRTLPLLSGDIPKEKRDLIWPWPLGEESMRNHYRQDILKPAGLPFDGKHLFHCLRRTGITEVVNVAGIEAGREQARHVSPSTTIESYVGQARLQRKNYSQSIPNPAAPRQLELL